MKKRIGSFLVLSLVIALLCALMLNASAATNTVTIKTSEFEAEQGEVFSTTFTVEATSRVEVLETALTFDNDIVSVTSNSIYTFGTNEAFEVGDKKYVVHSYQDAGEYKFAFFEISGNPSNSLISSVSMQNYTQSQYGSFTLIEDDTIVLRSFISRYGVVLFNSDIQMNVTGNQILISWIPNNTNINGTAMFMLQFVAEDNLAEGKYTSWLHEDENYDSFAEYNDASLNLQFNIAPLSIYGYGDINFDNTVDTRDALRARQHYLRIEGRILSGLRLKLGDVNFDDKVNTRDALYIQKYKIKLIDTIGNRFKVTFYDDKGEIYCVKSVVVGNSVIRIPEVPAKEGYSEGVWSLSADGFIQPDFTNVQSDIKVFARYDDSTYTTDALEYYKRILQDQYYSGDLPTNLSSDLNLWSTLNYQSGYHAALIWSSDCNYVLNSTTGKFTKPTYPQDMTLNARIISYDANDRIEGEDNISFAYAVPGEYVTPTKAAVEDFLRFYFTDSTDGKYRINYDAKLITKINNTVIPVEGSMYDNFEIRVAWFQNVNGTLKPISQVKRTTSSQVNDYVAVVTFNGKPLEDDGKIYIDNVEVTPIDQMEIKNFIINKIAASQGTLATNNTALWNSDNVYGTSVTWETGNANIGYVENNVIKLRDDAISGTTLPLNARVSYEVDGGVEEFVLSYNLTVSCNNTIIHAPENMDPGLYKAIKMELEENLGYRGDLTSAALANVKFVNLDLSEYQKMAKEYNILRAEHPEQYPDDTYPEIASFRGLSYCKNLRTLNISGVEVTDASMNQIATLSYLEAFIARGCNLDNLADGGTPTLKNAVNLKMIDLTDNNFTTLNSVFAPGVRYGSLREVYLSDNKLTDINALSRAPMMTYLSLSGNGLTTAGTASIANFPYLQYLSLAHNNIDSIEHLTGLKYLTELRLHYNALTDVRNLRKLLNLEILYLGHNQIQEIGFFNTLAKLEVLYVNDNRISDISNLTSLSKLELINVSNNRLSSLSVLRNYKATLTEVYAENNSITDFSFINGATNLHILMLSGNKVELPQDNMSTWLAGLTKMQVLTLSDIRLNDLAFLSSMNELVRLDVANCGLSAFSGDESNLALIAERYAKLRVLDISNNDMHGYESEVLKLRNATLLTVLLADNICDSLDAYTLTYSMTELKFISLENNGISGLNWLYKYNNLVYVDLAGNNISDVNFEAYISNASIKTLDELYLDTNVECSFANAYYVADFNVSKLSLEGVSVNKMENLPYLDNISYLNLSNTGLTNLTGDDLEMTDSYSVERYSTVSTIDVSGLETEIAPLEELPALETVYAVGVPASKLFYEDNLHSLQRMYNKGITCYLYDKQTMYKPVATVEGTGVLNLIKDFSCNITVAADNKISNNNPFIIDEINDFDITWSVSNSDNYEIKDNYLSVKSYSGIEDEELTVTASIVVYPDQAPVTRDFTINTHILRAAPKYYNIDATGYSEQLTRDSNFNYDLTLISAETENFSQPVKPVEDNIAYSYKVVRENGEAINYDKALVVKGNNRFAVASDAPLNSTITICIDITHNSKNGNVVKDIEQISVPITVASRTFTATFVMNGGTIVDSNGLSRESIEFVEDSLIFDNLTFSKPGNVFNGWFTDTEFTDLFSEDGSNAKMPNHNLTLYAKWEALNYTIFFDANGGGIPINTAGDTVPTTSITALSDVPLGNLPVATRQYHTFDGWFTAIDGGEQVTSESVFARTTTLTLYAHWTLNSFIVSFDANGGTVRTSELRAYCGEALGTLPIPTRDYYRFDGWFTSASGGEQVSASKTYATAADVTLYAHWTINPTSGWVIDNQVPSDAEVVSTKYSYTHRYYTSSGSSSMSGWTKYDTKRTSWGPWSSWSTTNPSNGVRNVETRSVYDHTEYHYYRWTNSNHTTMYTYKNSSAGATVLEERWFTRVLPNASGYTAIGYDGSDKVANWWARADYDGNYSVDKTWSRSVNRTEYRYQDPVYTYYYYQDRVEEGSSQPSGSDYTNIVKWVQYRPKQVIGYETEVYTEVNGTSYNGHNYILFAAQSPVKWSDAKLYCEQVGGYLAVITSAAEENAINSIATGCYSWIGLSKTPATNWSWVNGEGFSYSNWNTGEPNCSGGNEFYAGTYTDDKWNDYTIDSATVKYFIMESN